jgi:hypothetical protein
MKPNPLEYQIHREDHAQHAIRGDLNLTVEHGRLFKRRAQTFRKQGSELRTLLVAELDGVFVYVGEGGHILVTKNSKVKP